MLIQVEEAPTVPYEADKPSYDRVEINGIHLRYSGDAA
jgi:hypothetical protein